ncbi:MAG TPA: hypothetical protein ENJ79_06955 [Gammaproteobacteria bacterium]|nr:hypothetical protein [Gammaproteobacteria bacterium]
MRHTQHLRILLTFLAGTGFSAPSVADSEFLLFPELLLEHRQGDSSDDVELTPSLDVFGTARRGRMRLLGEVVANDEDVEIERLQLGYAFSSATTLWAGRVHNPLGYWTTQYHHGGYLQPSISRPEAARFGDKGGLFPSHIVGLLLDTTRTSGDRAFDYSLLAGLGPELRTGRAPALHSVDLLDVNSGRHKLSVTGRFAYRPDSASGNQAGLFASYVKMPVAGSAYDTLELGITGAFFSWQLAELGLSGALYRVRDALSANNSKDDGNFSTGYVEVDYPVHETWTSYARLEHSLGDNKDRYVGLMSDFIPERQVLGLRWDFNRKQALKVEYSSNHAGSKRFGSTLLNWSAVFP